MKLWKQALGYLRSFLLFAVMVGFVITCTFLVFFSSVELPEEDVRAFAPVVFLNMLILAVLFLAVDVLRRKLTVDRPVKEIRETLQKLMGGDFSARVSSSYNAVQYNKFGEVAESINHLARELGSVETLRTDFIANVSHELKTPLAVMQNYGTLLQAPGLSEEKRREYAAAITAQSRRLASLITNILKLSKLENQQIFPSVSEYDLGEQLCECLLQFEDAWEKKELNIETALEEGVMIRSDSELLSLVWNNLLSNAVKFTPDGGTIAVTLQSEGDHVIVQVADSGCGMTPEVGAHMFEKFYQGDRSHATQGNGLGLALVKRVVDILNGEIHVQSQLGKGSTFTVRFRRY